MKEGDGHVRGATSGREQSCLGSRWIGSRPVLWTLVTALVLVLGGCGGSSGESHASSSGSSPPQASADSNDVAGPERVVPIGRVRADVLGPTALARAIQLIEKGRSQVDAKALLEYVVNRPAGEPFPVDQALGLTPAESEELRQLAKETKLVKVREATFTVTKTGRVLQFDGGQEIPELHGITLDLNAGTVTTPFGVARERSAITPNDRQPLPWEGSRWGFEDGAITSNLRELTLTTFSFSVGRFVDEPRGVLYYRVRAMRSGNMIANTDLILTFPLPAGG